jgi:type II secretory pathway component HofQ
MRTLATRTLATRTLERVLLPGLLLTWALSHAAVFGGDAKTPKNAKAAKEPPSIEQIRKALDRPVTIDFSGQSLMEALQHMREKAGVEMNLDQMALAVMGVNINENGDQPITLKSSGGKFGVTLRKLLASHQLTYVIFEDAILITTPELAVQRQMKQRVILDVNEQPLAKALRELARNYAFNLVIDPKLAEAAQKPVSLALDGATLETSVRLLAEMAGLKAARMDNVMIITSEERAEKLRKEEKDFQPPPLDDLNMPNLRALLGGGGGGGVAFAGPAFRPIPLPPAKDAVDAPPRVPPP